MLSPALLLAAAAGLAADVAPAEKPREINEIRLTGLTRTEPKVALRELPFKAGEAVSDEAFELGVARLWNLGVFSRVDARVSDEGGRRVAIFDLEERWTLNPLVKFATTGTTAWVRLGVAELNLAGKYIEAAAQYERFGLDAHGTNGFQAWLRDPRLFDRRLGGLLQVERLARPRPGFVDFRTMVRLEVTGEPLDQVALFARADAMDDAIGDPPDTPPSKPPASRALVFTGGARVGRVDTIRLQQQGFSFELRPSFGLVESRADSTFWSVLVEGLAFRRFGERVNLAARAQVAVSTTLVRPYGLFVGGLDLVRGLPDNALEVPVYALANVELRVVAFDSTWFALVPTVFTDVVYDVFSFRDSAFVVAVGGGVRLLVPKLVATGLRVDVAAPLGWTDPAPKLSLGVYQFF